MKHYSICDHCDFSSAQIPWAAGELESSLVAVCTCLAGHVSIVGLLHHLPDVLYGSAVKAFRQGYYGEAVLSFAAALERTFELFVKAYCVKSGASVESVFAFWKEVENQSERQYGAFCQAYLLIARKPWNADQKQVGFRNKVIHKGHIATRDEVFVYASYITERLDSMIALMHVDLSQQCREIYFFNKTQAQVSIKKIIEKHPTARYVGEGMPSLLRWNHGNRQRVTFQSAIDLAAELEQRFGR